MMPSVPTRRSRAIGASGVFGFTPWPHGAHRRLPTLQEGPIHGNTCDNGRTCAVERDGAFRTLYTSEVIAVINEQGILATYEDIPDIQVRLYSPYPFLWRHNR